MNLEYLLRVVVKTIDGFFSPLILSLLNIIIIDTPEDVVFGKLRGLILFPFIKKYSFPKYHNIPKIGRNVYFLELLTRNYSFGKNVVISNNCSFHGPISIGDDTYLNYSVEVRSYTEIGKNVSIGPNTLIISDTHSIGNKFKRAGGSQFKKITIQDGCWIGAKVTIIGGVTISKGSVIGAGSVVLEDVPENSLVAGVPAKFIRKLNF